MRGDRGIARFVPGALRRSYAAKFLAAFLFTILVVSVVGGVHYLQVQTTIEADASRQVVSQAEVRTEMAGQWVRATETQVRTISSTTKPVSLSLKDAKAGASGRVLDLYYVGPNGTVEASTEEGLEGRSVRGVDSPWVRTFDAVAFPSRWPSRVWTTESSFEHRGLPSVGFVSPTPDGEAAVVAVVSVRELREFYGSDPMSTALVNARGEVVFSSDPELRRGYGGDPGFADSRRGRDPVLVEGRDALLVYAPVDGTDWATVSRVEKDVVFQAARAVGDSVTRGVAVTLLLLVLVGLVLGRHTVVPLQRLRGSTRSIQRGDFGVDLTTDRVDEIGRLFRDFSEMRDALRDQIAETEESNRKLERQRDELETLNQVVGHDLRSDLTLIRAYGNRLDEFVEDEEMRRSVEMILECTDGAVEFTDRAREIAEMMMRTDADNGPVPLRPVLRHQVEDIRSTETEAKVEVRGEVPDVEVVANDMLDSVFRNLLTNAVRHSDRGSPGVTVSVEEMGRDVEVSVADDGPGVPDDRKDSIFGRGEKEEDSGGTGVGLHLVKTLVESYGGEVRVEDNEPRGAVFAVTLRRAG